MTRARNSHSAGDTSSRLRNVMAATIFINVTSFSMLYILAPQLTRQLVGGDDAEASRVFGTMLTVQSLLNMFSAPMLGRLSDDTNNRRSIILFQLWAQVPMYLLYYIGDVYSSLSLLMAARILSGISGNIISLAGAYLTDISTPQERVKAFGIMGLAIGVGFAVGPAIGSILPSILGLQLTFLVCTVIQVVCSLYAQIYLVDSRPFVSTHPDTAASEAEGSATKKLSTFDIVRRMFLAANPWRTISMLLLESGSTVRGLAIANFVAQCGQQGFFAIWANYSSMRYGFTSFEWGMFLTGVGLGTALVQGFILERITRALGDRGSLIFGTSMNILTYLMIGFATQSWLIVASIVPASLGGIAFPVMSSILSRHVDSHKQGALQGSLSNAQLFARTISSSLIPWIFYTFTSSASMPVMPGMPFFTIAALCTVSLLLIYGNESIQKKRNT